MGWDGWDSLEGLGLVGREEGDGVVVEGEVAARGMEDVTRSEASGRSCVRRGRF